MEEVYWMGDKILELGKYKMTKACIYFKTLADLNLEVLEKLSKASMEYTLEVNEGGCREG